MRRDVRLMVSAFVLSLYCPSYQDRALQSFRAEISITVATHHWCHHSRHARTLFIDIRHAAELEELERKMVQKQGHMAASMDEKIVLVARAFKHEADSRLDDRSRYAVETSSDTQKRKEKNCDGEYVCTV